MTHHSVTAIHSSGLFFQTVCFDLKMNISCAVIDNRMFFASENDFEKGSFLPLWFTSMPVKVLLKFYSNDFLEFKKNFFLLLLQNDRSSQYICYLAPVTMVGPADRYVGPTHNTR